MKYLKNKLFAIFICNIFIWNVSSITDCSMNYIVPIFGETTGCIGIFRGVHYNCHGLISNILVDCGSEIIRKFITVFDFNFNVTYMCPTNSQMKYTHCQSGYNINHTSILKHHQYYGIKGQLEKKFEKNQKCNNNSLVLFLIGIPCSQMEFYPDVNELFITNLNDTIEYFQRINLRAVVALLYSNNLFNFKHVFCSDSLTSLKFSDSDFLKTQIVIYDDIIDLSDKVRDLCSFTPKIYPKPPNYPPINEWKTATISIASGVVLGLIILFIAFWLRQIWARWQQSKIEAFADEHAKSARHIIFGKYKDEWEVTPKELKVDASIVLGQGAFGLVYKGHLKKQRNKEWIEMDVAVKFTHENSDEKMRQDMIEEIGFMKNLGSHENLLTMVGYVKSIDNPVICTVFCSNGDLLGILRKHSIHFMSKEKCHEVEICLLLPDILRLALEICDGLIYLSSFNYVHRDIAARNVLLTNTLQAKLADFGLCKKLEFGETTIIDKNGKFPVKYMPYESIKFGEFSEKSDVWSFGILLFEMFSGGQIPFKNIKINNFIELLEQDGKITMPDLTPQPIIQLLNDKIFQKYPSKRADFKDVKKELRNFYFVVCNVVLLGKNKQ